MSVSSIISTASSNIIALDPSVRYRRKLNAAAAVQARLLYAIGYSKAAIARELGCTPQNVHLIVTRKTWKNV